MFFCKTPHPPHKNGNYYVIIWREKKATAPLISYIAPFQAGHESFRWDIPLVSISPWIIAVSYWINGSMEGLFFRRVFLWMGKRGNSDFSSAVVCSIGRIWRYSNPNAWAMADATPMVDPRRAGSLEHWMRGWVEENNRAPLFQASKLIAQPGDARGLPPPTRCHLIKCTTVNYVCHVAPWECPPQRPIRCCEFGQSLSHWEVSQLLL